MSSLSLKTRIADLPRALVLTGLLLTVVLTMFRPAGAQALLPASAQVFVDNDGSAPATVYFDTLSTVEREYKVLFDRKTSATPVQLTGVPIVDLLAGMKNKKDEEISKAPYVKIRFGDSDAFSMLVALNGGSGPGETPPPIILTKGERPGKGAFPTPAIVPGQPDPTQPISEQSIAPFHRRNDKLNIVPMAGRIFGVTINRSKRDRKGRIHFTAKAVGAPSGALKYQWISFDVGNPKSPQNVSTSPRWISPAPSDDGANAGVHAVRVIVTATSDGSTGTQSEKFSTNRKSDGAVKDPGYGEEPTGSTGDIGNGGNQGGNNDGSVGNPAPVAPSQPDPQTQQPQPTPPPTPPTSQPTPPTSETPPSETATQTVDTSGVVKAAQSVSVSSSTPVVAVNGVLLGTPAESSAGGGGGGGEAGGSIPGLTPLQQSAQTLAESIFKPVENPRDLWPYLVTLLFALGISGGVREWINP